MKPRKWTTITLPCGAKLVVRACRCETCRKKNEVTILDEIDSALKLPVTDSMSEARAVAAVVAKRLREIGDIESLDECEAATIRLLNELEGK